MVRVTDLKFKDLRLKCEYWPCAEVLDKSLIEHGSSGCKVEENDELKLASTAEKVLGTELSQNEMRLQTTRE